MKMKTKIPVTLYLSLSLSLALLIHPSIAYSDAEQDGYDQQKTIVLARQRKTLIQDIRQLIQDSKHPEHVVDLSLRLASLYFEDYKVESRKAQGDEKNHVKTKQKGAESLIRARDLYRDLSRRFQNHSQRDKMLYFLALSHIESENNAEGIATFEKLVVEYPASSYVADAVVQIADYYFESNKFSQASTFYDRVIANKAGSLLPYAMYKKGWCEYHQKRPASALEYFKQVIAFEHSADAASTSNQVKDEAIRDISVPFVDLKLVGESIAFFRGQQERHRRIGLETMAALYLAHGNHAEAIALNEELLIIDSGFSKNPNYELAIIESLHLKNEHPKSLLRLFASLGTYLKTSNWYELNGSQPEVLSAARTRYEGITRQYALEAHAVGQKTKNEGLYEEAQELYSKYLEYFPNTAQSPVIGFYLAEIQYRQKQYLTAANTYHQVYKMPETLAPLKYEALQNTVNSLANEINGQRKAQGLNKINFKPLTRLNEETSTVGEAAPLTDAERLFVSVSDEYVNAYPKAGDAAEVLYEQGYLLHSHADLEPAHQAFSKLTGNYAGTPSAYSGAYLILDIHNRSKNYEKMVGSCQGFLRSKDFSEVQFRKDIGNILRRSELKRIALLEESSQFKEAGEAYSKYIGEYGSQDESLFEKALYNASVNFSKASLFVKAVEAQEKFHARFPKSVQRENMLLQTAKAYEALAALEKAAYYFEKFVTEYPQRPQTKEAWRVAGIYFWGAGNSLKAEAVMTGFLKAFPKERSVVEGDLEELYTSAGARDKLSRYYLEARAERGIPLSRYLQLTLKLAAISEQQNGLFMEEAVKTVQKFEKDLSQTPRGVEAMGSTLFWFVQQREVVFHQIPLESNLQRKLVLLKELEGEYSKVAALGGESGLGALYQTATLYRAMANEVQQAPIPSELTGEQVDIYRAEIEKEMLRPFREKALAVAGLCLEKAQEFKLLSSWTSQCYALAGELNASEYPLVRTFYLPSQQVAIIVPNESAGTTALGAYKNHAFPYASSSLFSSNGERSFASLGLVPALSAGRGVRYDDSRKVVPQSMTYQQIGEERRNMIQTSLRQEQSGPHTSFNSLHLLRMENPGRAVRSIQEAIQLDPGNPALHGLLGLAYMDLGQYAASKATFLSMLARGFKNPEIQNNLGVLESLQGRDGSAISYFKEAVEGDSTDAIINLGFVALKYRNGTEAGQLFEKALLMNEGLVSAQVGAGIALIQKRDFTSAKKQLSDVHSRFKNDPFSVQSLNNLSADTEPENVVSQKLVSGYVTVEEMPDIE